MREVWKIEDDPVNKWTSSDGPDDRHPLRPYRSIPQRLVDPDGGTWPLYKVGEGVTTTAYGVYDNVGTDTGYVLKQTHEIRSQIPDSSALERMSEWTLPTYHLPTDGVVPNKFPSLYLQQRGESIYDRTGSLMKRLLAGWKRQDVSLGDFHQAQFVGIDGKLKVIDTDTATNWAGRDFQTKARPRTWYGQNDPNKPFRYGDFDSNRRPKSTPVPDPIQDVYTDRTPRATKAELFASGELSKVALRTQVGEII